MICEDDVVLFSHVIAATTTGSFFLINRQNAIIFVSELSYLPRSYERQSVIAFVLMVDEMFHRSLSLIYS